ncbi:uncharacterized protein UV8b_05588 [Ustilaginoidea virens]|uniref:Uncharacterized protein n=1 Tax=Ustilaginoidea virens TaxID=1159556 RepID=A0A8E5HTZ1_USTVR|nr:uncharacterized protein UV8b_05588 [Ustilaginoidea virens]QUC21345.1 hypothetical protein UV8b_05588 [Ustilaginoidea virens]
MSLLFSIFPSRHPQDRPKEKAQKTTDFSLSLLTPINMPYMVRHSDSVTETPQTTNQTVVFAHITEPTISRQSINRDALRGRDCAHQKAPAKQIFVSAQVVKTRTKSSNLDSSYTHASLSIVAQQNNKAKLQSKLGHAQDKRGILKSTKVF